MKSFFALLVLGACVCLSLQVCYDTKKLVKCFMQNKPKDEAGLKAILLSPDYLQEMDKKDAIEAALDACRDEPDDKKAGCAFDGMVKCCPKLKALAALAKKAGR